MRSRLTVHISPPERAARIGPGPVSVIGAVVLLIGSSELVTAVLAALLGAGDITAIHYQDRLGVLRGNPDGQPPLLHKNGAPQ